MFLWPAGYDCFPTGSMYVYIYILFFFSCPLTRVCVVYVVKEVTSFLQAIIINFNNTFLYCNDESSYSFIHSQDFISSSSSV